MDEVRTQWVTVSLMAAVVLFLVGSDIWLAHAYGVNATYSRVSFQLCKRYPIIYPAVVFALGLLVGHLTLPTFIRK